MTLKPDAKVTFELKRFTLALEKLPAGKYKARVVFWQDPLQKSSTSYRSPDVEFAIEKKE